MTFETSPIHSVFCLFQTPPVHSVAANAFHTVMTTPFETPPTHSLATNEFHTKPIYSEPIMRLRCRHAMNVKGPLCLESTLTKTLQLISCTELVKGETAASCDP